VMSYTIKCTMLFQKIRKKQSPDGLIPFDFWRWLLRKHFQNTIDFLPVVMCLSGKMLYGRSGNLTNAFELRSTLCSKKIQEEAQSTGCAFNWSLPRDTSPRWEYLDSTWFVAGRKTKTSTTNISKEMFGDSG
jgi:hypothetical protein